jgi:hypothetical protein
MTTNGKGGLSPLTPKFKEINSVLERIHQNRISRKRLNQEILVLNNTSEVLLDFSPHF